MSEKNMKVGMCETIFRSKLWKEKIKKKLWGNLRQFFSFFWAVPRANSLICNSNPDKYYSLTQTLTNTTVFIIINSFIVDTLIVNKVRNLNLNIKQVIL